jgi:putative drug exporter of the RND superfamily
VAVSGVTRLCLRHRRLVVQAWLVLTVAGALTASMTTDRLTHSFATPGTAGYDTNLHLLQTSASTAMNNPQSRFSLCRPARA